MTIAAHIVALLTVLGQLVLIIANQRRHHRESNERGEFVQKKLHEIHEDVRKAKRAKRKRR